MEGKDEIKDFFSNTLNNHELPVRADLWQGIASQMGTTTAVTSTSIWTKLAIATVGLATASMVIYAVVKNDVQQVPKKGNIQTEQKVNHTKEHKPEEEHKPEKPRSTQQKTAFTWVTVPTTIPFLGISQLVENSLKLNQTQPFVSLPEQLFQVDLIENQSLPSIESNPSIGSSNEQKEAVSSDPVISQVQEVISASEKSDKIGTLSNVFTPNGDNVNDFLFVESTQLSDFQVVVMDKYNKTVFTSTDPSFRWDGIGLSGEPVPAGNYVYFITARDEDGKPVNKYSTLRIER